MFVATNKHFWSRLRVTPLLKQFSQFKHEFVRVGRHKAKTYIPDKYLGIPEWCEVKQRDPFNYTLRTKEEVQKQIQETRERGLGYEIEYEEHNRGQPSLETIPDTAHLIAQLDLFKLSDKQKERLKFLAEHRYDINKNQIKITVNDHRDAEDNGKRAYEIFYEVMLESLRAPLD